MCMQNVVGHQTTGEGHGRHTKRTLASLSMEDKVVVRYNHEHLPFPGLSLAASLAC
jgi:hypothetical protein